MAGAGRDLTILGFLGPGLGDRGLPKRVMPEVNSGHCFCWCGGPDLEIDLLDGSSIEYWLLCDVHTSPGCVQAGLSGLQAC